MILVRVWANKLSPAKGSFAQKGSGVLWSQVGVGAHLDPMLRGRGSRNPAPAKLFVSLAVPWLDFLLGQ